MFLCITVILFFWFYFYLFFLLPTSSEHRVRSPHLYTTFRFVLPENPILHDSASLFWGVNDCLRVHTIKKLLIPVLNPSGGSDMYNVLSSWLCSSGAFQFPNESYGRKCFRKIDTRAIPNAPWGCEGEGPCVVVRGWGYRTNNNSAGQWSGISIPKYYNMYKHTVGVWRIGLSSSAPCVKHWEPPRMLGSLNSYIHLIKRYFDNLCCEQNATMSSMKHIYNMNIL